MNFFRLEEDLSRHSRYISENVDLHVYKTQIENSYRAVKEENESHAREKFELQEEIIDKEHQLHIIREERDQYLTTLLHHEQQLKEISVRETNKMFQ